MLTIAEIRQQYPQYGDMSDSALADALYSKHYADMPRATFDQKIGLQMPQPPTASPFTRDQVPTFDPTTSERAAGMRQAITGPSSGTQQDWFQKQQAIERELHAAGKTDEEIGNDPRWQEAARNLAGSVSAAATSTAIGETAGAGIAAGAGAAVSRAAKPVVGIVKDAIGRDTAAATKEVASEAARGVAELQKDAQRATATKGALDKVTAERPGATVLDAQTSAPVDAAKVTQARTATRDAARKLADANTRLQAAQRNLASLDKYAGQRRSQAMVSAARRDLNSAQNEVNRLTQQHAETADAQKEVEAAHKQALDAAKKGERRQATSERQINRDAANAKTKIDSLKIWGSRLNAAKKPEDIAPIARNIADQMLKSDKMTTEQHTRFLSRVSEMLEKSKSTQDARQKFVILLRDAGLFALGAGAGSYAVRRL